MDSVIYKRGVSRKTWFTPKKGSDKLIVTALFKLKCSSLSHKYKRSNNLSLFGNLIHRLYLMRFTKTTIMPVILFFYHIEANQKTRIEFDFNDFVACS